MAYYFVGQDSQSFGAFQKRFSFLEGGLFISNKAQLKKEISEMHEISFFFVHYYGEKEFLDEFVLLIREKLPDCKVIYLIEKNSALDLKQHQITPVGGDAYVYQGVDEETFREILSSLGPQEINYQGNKLEEAAQESVESEVDQILRMKNDPISQQIDQVFMSVIKEEVRKPKFQNANELNTAPAEEEENMSTKDNEIEIDGLEELELSTDATSEAPAADEGLELKLDDGPSLDLAGVGEELPTLPEDDGLSLEIGDDEGLELGDLSDESGEELSLGDEAQEVALEDNLGELDLGSLDVAADTSTGVKLDLSDESETGLSLSGDLSEDAKEKLKEIDAILDLDASQAAINVQDIQVAEAPGGDLDLSGDVLSDDLGLSVDVSSGLESEEEVSLDGLDFSSPESVEGQAKPLPAAPQILNEKSQSLGSDFKEISHAYSGEMERTQATIANLRADREELLNKIGVLEDEKVLHNRQVLSLRAELDEKKIELTIIRKKNNEEISELKDRIKLFDEKRLILEEKNKILQQELDKASQKNKLDVKKIQLHERELEQRLELLKSDSETQIKNRDLKILELKRKIDAMEFDMESISTQEKRSVESRYELEDKLEKAIKTLRNAITVLEDETDKGSALEALKKNIDM